VTAARVLGASGCGSGSTVGGAGTITVFTYGGDDEGASGTEFASTSYTGNAAPALLGSGKAAMQLMGSWDYANQLTNYPDFAEDDEGYTSFPDVAGGIGDPADVVGNPSNYWSVSAKTAHLSTAIAFLQYMTSETYTKSLLSGGRIPTATSTASLLPSYSNPAFGQFQYQMVQKAPSFQLSWDQALPSAVGTPLDTEVGRFFAGAVSVAQFEQAMAQTQKNAG
jgi:xylobiose transport system substrate-binding protein